ncbi:MAG: sulfite dehydrogenase [Candidatus Binatia bacterium]
MKTEKVTRRRFLKTGVLIGGTLTTSALSGLRQTSAADQQPSPPPPDPTKLQGRPASAYGERTRFETLSRITYPPDSSTPAASFTPLQHLRGIVTPASLHYERHHAGIPDIDPATHRLLIHGLVRNPLIFTTEEIRRFPSVSRLHFLECSGNGFTEWGKPSANNVQVTHGLTSCSEWTGVRLSVLLQEVGYKPRASWIIAEGADGAAMTRSLPLSKCLDDVIVAYGQNGEALRPEQGYPLRLIVPGWEGSTHVKWLRRLKVVDKPYQTREETAKYTDLMPNGSARQFTFVMEAKSVITFPAPGLQLSRPGFYEITGLAWSGRGKVKQVEVSLDGGLTWQTAELQEPILPVCHTRFRLPWRWNGTEAILQSRCTDETGYVQPTRAQLTEIRGTHSEYHLNAIHSWQVTSDGKIHNV